METFEVRDEVELNNNLGISVWESYIGRVWKTCSYEMVAVGIRSSL